MPPTQPGRPRCRLVIRLPDVTTLADATPVGSTVAAPVRGAAASIRAYIALTKPRIIELLLVTTIPTMILAERGWPSFGLVIATLVGGSMAAGSANALNCWYDRDIDAVMRRTKRRPLVRHAVEPGRALVFGLVLGVLAAVELALTTNLLAAVLSVVAIAFYVVGYTMLLKRRTSQNIVWGGAAGCMPVLIGWAAVTGSLSWAPMGAVRRSSSSGPRRTTGRSPCATATTTPRADVPMLPVVATGVWWWPTRIVAVRLGDGGRRRCCWPGRWGSVRRWLYGVATAAATGAVFLREAHLLL